MPCQNPPAKPYSGAGALFWFAVLILIGIFAAIGAVWSAIWVAEHLAQLTARWLA